MQRFGEVKLFAEGTLDELLNQRSGSIKEKIWGESSQYLFNVNEDEYLGFVNDEFRIELLFIHFEGCQISEQEEMISADRFPCDFYVREHNSYPKKVVTYHIPYTGNEDLLRLRPSAYLVSTRRVTRESGCICFKIINFRDNPDEIMRDAEDVLNFIRTQVAHVNDDLNRFNTSIPVQATSTCRYVRVEVYLRPLPYRPFGEKPRSARSLALSQGERCQLSTK